MAGKNIKIKEANAATLQSVIHSLNRNDSVRTRNPPHASPLPKERENVRLAFSHSPFSAAVDATAHMVPCPRGEGQDEGDQDDPKPKPLDKTTRSQQSTESSG